jgi:hypothetical protein
MAAAPDRLSHQDGRHCDQDGLADELVKRVRRSESHRLARIYADILSEGARKKTREEEDREWQFAAQREDGTAEPGWGAVLKRGTLFAVPLLFGPATMVLIGHWLCRTACTAFVPRRLPTWSWPASCSLRSLS